MLCIRQQFQLSENCSSTQWEDRCDSSPLHTTYKEAPVHCLNAELWLCHHLAQLRLLCMNQNSLAGRTGNSNSIWAHLLLFLKEGAHLQVRTVSMAQARPRHLLPTRCGLKRGPVGAQFTTNSINLCQTNFVLWCKRSQSNCCAHTL